MALFGSSGGSSTTKISRPQYVQNMINDLSSQVQNLKTPQWQNQQYAGLTSDQQTALDQMMASPELRAYASQLTGAGQEGVNQLSDLQNQVQSAYGKQITADDINRMADQLYNRGEVEEAIKAANRQTEQQLATSTNPEAAQQTM
ncbi:hypothetical protein, partial [Herbiconiux daphne]